MTAKLNERRGGVVTEYRGMSVRAAGCAAPQLRPAGGEYKVYKNTLARLAAEDAGCPGLAELLVGPTAVTFVTGDVAAVAKALRDAPRRTRCWS